jgi:hypothetical protein
VDFIVWVYIDSAAPSDGGKWCFVKVMSKSHYYMVDTSVVMKGTAVTKLEFILMSEEAFEVHGLKVMFFSCCSFSLFQHLETVGWQIFIISKNMLCSQLPGVWV